MPPRRAPRAAAGGAGPKTETRGYSLCVVDVMTVLRGRYSGGSGLWGATEPPVGLCGRLGVDGEAPQPGYLLDAAVFLTM